MSANPTDFTDPIEFDSLERVQVPVTLGKEKYILLEGSGDVAIKYRDAIMATINKMKDGKPDGGLKGIATVESYLLSLTLYKVTETGGTMPMLGDGSPDPNYLVPQQVIRSWPNRIISMLYERAKQISGLNLEDKAKELEGKTEEELKEMAEREDEKLKK